MRESRLVQVLSALVITFFFSTGMSECGGNLKVYPQFTAVFELVDEPIYELNQTSTFSTDQILGSYQLPKKIRVTDRMQYQSGHFFHLLRFDPLAKTLPGQKPEANASFTADFSALTRPYQGSGEYPIADGITLSKELGPRISTEPMCDVNYVWNIFIHPTLMSPSPAQLNDLYEAHNDVAFSDGSQLEVILNEQEQLEPPMNTEAFEAWGNTLTEKDELTFTIVFEMQFLQSTRCRDPQGMNRPTGKITATYRANLATYDDLSNPVIVADDSKDPNLTSVAEFKEGTDDGKALFSQLINKPWIQESEGN